MNLIKDRTGWVAGGVAACLLFAFACCGCGGFFVVWPAFVKVQETAKTNAKVQEIPPSGAEVGGGVPSAKLVVINSYENASDFVDNIAKYKGKTVTMPMQMDWRNTHVKGEQTTVRDFAGQDIMLHGIFFGRASSVSVDITARIPSDTTKLPAAKALDGLLITFTCNDGDLRLGNVVTEIKRR
jgi:hypothetical protein